MSIRAYQKVQQRVETPRETEYRLFTEVTRALNEVKALPSTELGAKMKALDWNRRVWNFLAMDCSNEQNGLPAQLRASIISLSMFVSKYTSQVIRENEDIEPLIDINIAIMQGLAAQNQLAQAQNSTPEGMPQAAAS